MTKKVYEGAEGTVNDVMDYKGSIEGVELKGKEGNDTLFGGFGNDTLDGGEGADAMTGGFGNDLYIVDNTNDTVTEKANQGIDTVQSKITYTLGDNVENLTLTGTEEINGTGNALDNIIVGNSVKNTLTGAGGKDTFIFNSVPDDSDHFDTIADFNKGEDVIKLDRRAFGVNEITDKNFVVNADEAKAKAPENRFIYYDGSLYYDADGNADDVAPVKIAEFTGKPALDDKDIQMVGPLSGAEEVNAVDGKKDVFQLADPDSSVTINNFESGEDRIEFGDEFTELKSGLGFVANETGKAGSADDRLVYNTTNGELFYDVDGSGNAVAVKIATFEGKPELKASDLAMISSPSINGDEKDNILEGTNEDDQIHGAGGDDLIKGLEGKDTLFGGDGNDTLIGNQQDDTLSGGDGFDSLRGSLGNDYLDGGKQADTLAGGMGNDKMYGGSGKDYLSAGQGDDTLSGGLGDDMLFGRKGADELYGDEGNDTLIGNEDNDKLFGGAGNDSLRGSIGNDSLEGGEGDDTLAGGMDKDELHGGAGADYLSAGQGDDKLYGDDGDDMLYGRKGADLLEGGTGNDTLIGNQDNDTLKGGAGHDTLRGSIGDDLLEGGTGNDVLSGGMDKDELHGGAGADYLSAGQGDDTLYGDDENQSGNDMLYGRKGDDVLSGGLGNDTLSGGDGKDVYLFDTALGAENVDTILDFTSGTDSIKLDKTVFTQLGDDLSAGAFVSSATGAAVDGDDRILYNTTTGALFYDADGKDGADAVQFATIEGKPEDLKATDFIVFGG